MKRLSHRLPLNKMLSQLATSITRSYNGPQYRGARIPAAEPGSINAINLPDNCRLKWLQADVVYDAIHVEYITQEPFSSAEGQKVVEEIARMLEYTTYCDVEIGGQITSEDDVLVAIDVECRDGKDYGYVTANVVIKDFQ